MTETHETGRRREPIADRHRAGAPAAQPARTRVPRTRPRRLVGAVVAALVAALVTLVSPLGGAAPAGAAGSGQYGAPEWFPLRTDLGGNALQIGCTYHSGGGCGGHHDYWALDLGLGAGGSPIYPSGAGQVIDASFQAGGWGNYVLVDHGPFGQSRYAHLATTSVSVGQWVDTTTMLGTIGQTGSASTPHLHYEYYDFVDAGSDDPGDLKACHGSQLVTYGGWAGIVPFTQYAYSDGTGCTFSLPQLTTRFHAIQPARILDSRAGPSNIGPYASPWSGGEANTRDINVAGQGGVPPDAVAVVLNVTAVDPSAGSFLQLWPKGAPRPFYGSSLNFSPGQVVANSVTVRIGDFGQVRIMNAVGSVDVVVDVAGYYRVDDDGAGFVPVTPARLVDSRSGNTNVGPYAAPWPAGAAGVRDVVIGGRGGVPVDAVAVVLNVTAVNPSDSSFLQLWPSGTAQPTFGSSVNFGPGQIVPNAVTVKLGAGGSVDVMNAVGIVDVVIDVAGYYTASGGSAFHPVQPDRAFDSRPGTNVGSYSTPWGPGTVRAVQIAGRAGVPGGARAVVANLTAVQPSEGTFVQLWPVGVSQPVFGSSVNAAAGQIVPNAVTVGLGFEGDVMVFNAAGSVDLVADVAGWFG